MIRRGALVAVLLLAAAVLLAPAAWRRRAVVAAIDAGHPGVTTVDAARWRPDPATVLVDVRTADEIAVSRIPGARTEADLRTLPPETPLVVYCSIGWRSAKAVGRLHAAGFRQVRNLSGGIFAWADAGRPLVDADGRPVAVVHPFSPVWGTLVSGAHRGSAAP